MIEVFTDAARKRTSKGGYGFIIKTRDHTIFQGGYLENITNNQGELQAVINALLKIVKLGLDHDSVIVYSDSSYFVTGFNEWVHRWKKRGWTKCSGPKGTPIANLNQWQALLILKDELNAKAIWVRGHNNNPENEFADRLANFSYDTGKGVRGFLLPANDMKNMNLVPYIYTAIK